MDNFEIVQKLRRISEIKNEVAVSIALLNRTVADAQIRLDPGCASPYPSTSGNTVAFLGTEQLVTRSDTDALIEVYRSRGIKRFFVFMSPSPWFKENLKTLETAGLTQFRGPDYHTLVRSVSIPIGEERPCAIRIERLRPGQQQSSTLLEPGTLSAVHRPEFDVWVAMDNDTLVGYGMATTVGSVTYLGGAATAEPYRNRGIQTAIIRARLQDAARRGSKLAVSETLSMLGSSLRNLQRAGFTTAYDKIVYQYSDE